VVATQTHFLCFTPKTLRKMISMLPCTLSCSDGLGWWFNHWVNINDLKSCNLDVILNVTGDIGIAGGLQVMEQAQLGFFADVELQFPLVSWWRVGGSFQWM